jgi:Tfp pilus assembly protein PilN
MKAVNLLPPDLRGTSSSASVSVATADVERSAGPYIVLGALALCVAMIAGYVLAGNTIKEREAELADMTNRQQAMAAKAASLKPYADFDALANERVATVRDLAGQRFDWEQSLRDLSRAIPADVTLTELNGTVSATGGTSGGGGASGIRGAINAPAIEVKGCTDSQRDVATLMARLRNIDGVTRVSLAKSERSSSTPTNAAADSAAGAGTTEGGCGAGNPPAFELVIFFENDAAAAAAASEGSSDAPVATPSATPAAGDSASATPTPTPAPGSEPSTPAATQEGVTP